MTTLHEQQMSNNIHLSDIQKLILAKVVAAATSQVAHEEISRGRNLVANRDILSKLGLLNITDTQASLTDTGIQLMKQENLINNDNTLTDNGNKYAQITDIYKLKDVNKEEAPEEPINTPEPSFESLILIKELNQTIIEQHLIKTVNTSN